VAGHIPRGQPARAPHHPFSLPDGEFVELLVAGVRGAKRTTVEIEGVRHKDPLPMAAQLEEFLFSSAIVPDAPDGSTPEGLAAVHQAFANLEAVMVGGATADMSRVENTARVQVEIVAVTTPQGRGYRGGAEAQCVRVGRHIRLRQDRYFPDRRNRSAPTANTPRSLRDRLPARLPLLGDAPDRGDETDVLVAEDPRAEILVVQADVSSADASGFHAQDAVLRLH
jgi:hypothetical protein